MTNSVISADLFCGAGGTSSGLVDACAELGLELQLVAINHWDVAIETHKASLPGVEHFCCDIGDVDPRQVFPGGRLRLLVASPECTHFSNARGGEPVTNQKRASVKYVLRWLGALEVEDVLIENVPEFRHWGPLHRKGPNVGKPITRRKGEFFNRFLSKMRNLGYTVDWRILCAADYGDATSRRRLFIRARKGTRPIVWPEPSHSAKGEETLFGRLPAYHTAREIIDWSNKGSSIFNRAKPLSPNTMRRIMAGLVKFSGLPFVLPDEGLYRGNAPRSMDEPLQTVTSRGAGHLVQPFVLGQQSNAAPRSVDEPLPTVAGAGAISLIEPFILATGQTGGNGDRVRSVDEPVPTIVGKAELCLVEPFIVGAGGPSGAGRPQSVDQPLGTVMGEDHRALMQPFLVPYHRERVGQRGRTHSVDEPIPTVATSPFGLVEPFLVAFHSEKEGGAARVSPIDKPLPTLTTEPRFGVAEPFLVKLYGTSDSAGIDEPAPTITGHGGHLGVAEPFIVQLEHSSAASGDERRVHGVDQPLPTLTAQAAFAIAEPYIVGGEHTSDDRVHSLDEPMPTITSKAHFGLAQPYLVKYYGQGVGQPVDEPLGTITSVEHFGLCIPVGDGYAVVDILFRMLELGELARAHGLDEFVFAGTKRDGVKQVGNSVPRRLAKALCQSALSN